MHEIAPDDPPAPGGFSGIPAPGLSCTVRIKCAACFFLAFYYGPKLCLHNIATQFGLQKGWGSVPAIKGKLSWEFTREVSMQYRTLLSTTRNASKFLSARQDGHGKARRGRARCSVPLRCFHGGSSAHEERDSQRRAFSTRDGAKTLLLYPNTQCIVIAASGAHARKPTDTYYALCSPCVGSLDLFELLARDDRKGLFYTNSFSTSCLTVAGSLQAKRARYTELFMCDAQS